jgi:Zn-dependent protease with chaperone function
MVILSAYIFLSTYPFVIVLFLFFIIIFVSIFIYDNIISLTLNSSELPESNEYISLKGVSNITSY